MIVCLTKAVSATQPGRSSRARIAVLVALGLPAAAGLAWVLERYPWIVPAMVAAVFAWVLLVAGIIALFAPPSSPSPAAGARDAALFGLIGGWLTGHFIFSRKHDEAGPPEV